MNKTLMEEFEIVESKETASFIEDYKIFENKDLLDDLRSEIIENIIDKKMPNEESLDTFINDQVDKTLEGYDLTNLERSHIYNMIRDEISGMGPITELISDKNVTEIMVNGPHDIYVEIDGNLIKDESVSFINDAHIIRTIQRLIQPLGRTIDSSNPMVDSRLSDGSRINAVIPPLSVKGPIMTIRKFKRDMNNIEDLLRIGTMTPYMARFLSAAVKGKLNIIVCGGTGSGKTTLLNVLSSFIGDYERIITIEDAAELKLNQPHVISLEAKTVNYKTDTEITIRDLVKNALRMRPDRIIVGECRGKEAFDMLQAMNTGHDGSLSTLHANGPIEALERFETMMLMAGMDLPVKAIREYAEHALDLIVNIERMADGKRKVTNISEIVGIENDSIKVAPIFEFVLNGLTPNGEVDGEFILHKNTPKVLDKLKSRGIDEVNDIFEF